MAAVFQQCLAALPQNCLVIRMSAKTGKVKKKKKLSGILFRLCIAAAAVYLVVSFVDGQLQVANKQRELAEITARLEAQEETNRELQRLMDSDDEDAYIERMAREQLGYAKPYERVFIDLTGK